MRDVTRIPLVMDSLKALWISHPDMRLGQLIANLLRDQKGNTDLYSIWSTEDLTLRAKIIEALQKGSL